MKTLIEVRMCVFRTFCSESVEEVFYAIEASTIRLSSRYLV